LEVHGLTKRYGTTAVVDDLTFSVPAGQVVGLLGPNGAGKTTAMRMMVGLAQPTSGSASLLGTRTTDKDFVHVLRRAGVMIEAPAIYHKLSARKNLSLHAAALGLRNPGTHISQLLEFAGLGDSGDDKTGTFSLGMKQRLGIALAMVGGPELVILDEPANGLDPSGIAKIRALLRRLPETGTSVLVSSHQLTEVELTCDSVVVISHGRLAAQGTISEILEAHSSPDLLVRIDPTEFRVAVAALSMAGIATSIVGSDQIRVTLPNGWTGREINRALTQHDVFVLGMAPASVSLEEAFLAMTGDVSSPADFKNVRDTR